MSSRTFRSGVCAAALALAGCRNPRADAMIFQQLNDAADQFANLRLDIGQLQDRIDSLTNVVTRQDSLLRYVANATGVPIGR